MKKALLLTIIALMAVAAKAAPTITQQQAKTKAQAFLEQRQASGKTMRRSSAVELREAATGISELYAFNAEGGGFVIVSADDSVDGVLGYSLHGAIDQDDMPPNMKAWLQGNAVAHLMRWAGLTVKMEYGVNMSGALTILIDKALRGMYIVTRS